MRTKFWGYLFLSLLILHYACLPAEEQFSQDISLRLQFSKNIIILDTLPTQIRNPSQRLQVYNPAKNAVRIDKIALGLNQNSSFSLIINGKRGTEFSNIEILGKDSLLIIIETNFNKKPIEVTTILDSITFLRAGILQEVKLLAWAEPVEILQNERISQETTWQRGKNYLIIDSLLIDKNAKLIIPDSIKVYFYNQASIRVQGELQIKGTAENLVIFAGFRREAEFSQKAGQWQGIRLEKGANADIAFLNLRNATTAFEVQEGKLSLKNTIIRNLKEYGILANNATIQLENTVISNCEKNVFFAQNGGIYSFLHTTMANYSFDFIRTSAAVAFDNTTLNRLAVSLQNTIIWGSRENELLITSNNSPSLLIENCLFKTNIPELLPNNSFQQNPLFENDRAGNFKISANSPAIDKGKKLGILIDARGKTRNDPPDIGAYEFVPE